jgi:hypothetical protein
MTAESLTSLITDWPSFFEQVRRRPAMWLDEPSLLALRNLIRGVELAETIYGITEDRALEGAEVDRAGDLLLPPRRDGDDRGPVLHQQPGRGRQAVRPRGPGPLGHRE